MKNKLLVFSIAILSLTACQSNLNRPTAASIKPQDVKKASRGLASVTEVPILEAQPKAGQQKLTEAEFSKATLSELEALIQRKYGKRAVWIKQYSQSGSVPQDKYVKQITVPITGFVFNSYLEPVFKLHTFEGDYSGNSSTGCTSSDRNTFHCALSDGEGGDNNLTIQKKNGFVVLEYTENYLMGKKYKTVRINPSYYSGNDSADDNFECVAGEEKVLEDVPEYEEPVFKGCAVDIPFRTSEGKHNIFNLEYKNLHILN